MPPFSDYGLRFFIPPRLLFVISLKHVMFVNDYKTENRVRLKQICGEIKESLMKSYFYKNLTYCSVSAEKLM